MVEQWAPIPGFESHYEVSNIGRVRGIPRLNARGYRLKSKVIHIGENSEGYANVFLWVDSKPHSRSIHRFVALNFVENPDGKPQVNHIDGNKKNNHFTNLEWVTSGENTRHAHRTGLVDYKKRSKKLTGNSNCPRMLVLNVVTGIYYDSLRKASTALEITHSKVYNNPNKYNIIYC